MVKETEGEVVKLLEMLVEMCAGREDDKLLPVDCFEFWQEAVLTFRS